jgi:hypothetical protein
MRINRSVINTRRQPGSLGKEGLYILRQSLNFQAERITDLLRTCALLPHGSLHIPSSPIPVWQLGTNNH